MFGGHSGEGKFEVRWRDVGIGGLISCVWVESRMHA